MNANRQRRKDVKPPPKCSMCRLDHRAVDCDSFLREEKMAIAKERKLCLICLAPNKHHPMKCRFLRFARVHTPFTTRASVTRLDKPTQSLP
ncbi:unnamed protein product [Caenorhabditis brenneri]